MWLYRFRLNIACPYTSTEELEHASLASAQTGAAFEECLYTAGLFPRVDMLVRTSGEQRLSNFLLYQVTHHRTAIYFVKSFWPAFSLWQFILLLMDYQTNKMTGEL